MTVFALGLNHTTAPLDLRGRLAFAPEQLTPALLDLRQRLQEGLPEAALVSTCNRTELYVAAGSASSREMVRPALDWLAERGGIGGNQLQSHSYVVEDGAAARHAFRVAAGLDSMVLGEPQILGQMKQAVRVAEEAGMLGTTLHQLFQRSFAVAKEVRSSTEIGAHSISMAAASVRLAAQLFEDSARKSRLLFVGAGEMIELVATHFAARQPKQAVLANRTLERGERLAARIGGEAMRLSDLPLRLHEFDAVISCTSSSLPIIGLGAVERALKARRRRPMFMVDLAVPRDIEPEVAALPDVYLYTLDDLSALVQSAGQKRQAAVATGRGDHRQRRAQLQPLAGPAGRRAPDPGAEPADAGLECDRTGARAAGAGAGRIGRAGAGSAGTRADAEDAAWHPGRIERRRWRRPPTPG